MKKRSIIAVSASLLAVFGGLILTLGCDVSEATRPKPDPYARDITQEGDLYRFILGNMINYGCRWDLIHVPTNELHCAWRCRYDSKGVQLYTAPENFAKVDRFVQSLFGQLPYQSKSGYTSYSAKQGGVAISCSLWKEPYPPKGESYLPNGYTQVIIVSPVVR